MTLWQSDKPIVAMKSRNGDGAKGLTGMRWGDRDTTSALRGGYRLSTKLSSLTLRARVYHKYPVLKGSILEEPNDRIGHVRLCERH